MLTILISIIFISSIILIGGILKYMVWLGEISIDERAKGRKDVEDLIIELFGKKRGMEIINHSLPMNEKELYTLNRKFKEKWG